MDSLNSDIKFLPGVGPKRAKLLAEELGIKSYADLLEYYPYKYIDKSKIFKVRDINSSQTHIQLKGKITGFSVAGAKRGKRLVAQFTDGTGSIELVWFKGIDWVQRTYRAGEEYLIFGKPKFFGHKINISHPDIESAKRKGDEQAAGFEAQYSLTEKLRNNYVNSKTIHKMMDGLLNKVKGNIHETLPPYLVRSERLMSYEEALFQIHRPQNTQILQQALHRLKFEELFYLQLNILKQKVGRSRRFKGQVFSHVGVHFNTFFEKNLPFDLTGAQKRVIKEIRADMKAGLQMNRLLQGDVGSGKTLVALMCMLIALDNGFQACLMAPTEILAQQHYKSVSEMLFGLPITVKLLTGSTKKAERKIIDEGLSSASLHILIGTHALIEDTVQFSNLGLVVIDEQHRFGVAQRAKMWKKNSVPPHILVMTATPIPRTLAMTVYGDLDVSVIDELPPGRKPIQTFHYNDSKRLAVFGFMRKQIDMGRQVYMVYPLIKESESLDYKDLEDGYEAVARAFPAPEYSVVAVHGRMKPEEKEKGMQLFASGNAQIMVATTVIEVGVNVPNATVMVIESAERFGLSQLHQLRGRVGRGADRSYCVLMSSYKLSKESKLRLQTMVRTNDGFEIAEADLKLRGPGDLEGTQQSGIAFDLKLSNLSKDGQMVQLARDVAERVLEKDPELNHEGHRILKYKLMQKRSNVKLDWSVIS